MNNQYDPLTVPQTPRKSFCKQHCHWKSVLLYIVCSLVLITLGAGGAFYFFYELTSGDECVVPKLKCAGSSPNLMGYYNAKKEYSFGFSFLYSVNFEAEKNFTYNDTSIVLGKMNMCVQTTGSMEKGPFNCSLSYFYDNSNCAFHYLNGDCDQRVSHEQVDNMFTGMQYASENDTLFINFSSHSQITGGTFIMSHNDTRLIKCDDVAEKVPPLAICDNPKEKKEFSFIESLKENGY